MYTVISPNSLRMDWLFVLSWRTLSPILSVEIGWKVAVLERNIAFYKKPFSTEAPNKLIKWTRECGDDSVHTNIESLKKWAKDKKAWQSIEKIIWPLHQLGIEYKNWNYPGIYRISMNVPGKALKFPFFIIFLGIFQFRMFPVFPQDGCAPISIINHWPGHII